MSRSGYIDDGENVMLWRRAVENAIAGKRGQKFLREMAAALDAMPVKELIADDVIADDGRVCAIGSVAAARNMSAKTFVDPGDADFMASTFNIAPCLAQEIAYENDDDFGMRGNETPAQRWTRMRAWVAAQLRSEGAVETTQPPFRGAR